MKTINPIENMPDIGFSPLLGNNQTIRKIPTTTIENILYKSNKFIHPTLLVRYLVLDGSLHKLLQLFQSFQHLLLV